MVVQNNSEQDNICCPYLWVFKHGDTKEHCHLVCDFSRTPVSNKTVKEICIGDNFKKCINNS